MANVRVRRRVRGASIAPMDGAWVAITTYRSSVSGVSVHTPVGLPVKYQSSGALVPRTKRNKICWRYAGDNSPRGIVQTEHYKHRTNGDDGLMHCTASFVTDGDYVAGNDIEIGWSDTYAGNWSTPSYPALSDNIEVRISTWTPKIFWISPKQTPWPGDILTLTMNDGAAQAYTKQFSGIYNEVGRAEWRADRWFWALALRISLDSSGRFWTHRDGPAPMQESPVPPLTYATDFFEGSINSSMSDCTGGLMGSAGNGDHRPYSWSTGMGFYLISRRTAGNPPDFTVNAQVTRAERVAITSAAALGLNCKKLAYTGQTTNFTTGHYVYGTVSKAMGRIRAQNDAGSTGTLYLDDIYLDFQAGESLVAYSGGALQSGNGTASGPLQNLTVTSSSGGTATCHGWGQDSNHVYFTDRLGNFNVSDTITITESGATPAIGGSTTQTGAIETSQFAIYTGPKSSHSGADDAPTTTNGLLTAVNSDRADRVEWRARLSDATATPDSPWMNGPILRCHELRTAFLRVSDNAAHPHLETFFRVMQRPDGSIVPNRTVTVENSKIFAVPGIRDYFYDAEIFVNGVSQTSGQTKYNDLFHDHWRVWHWTERPHSQDGFCSIADFMRARIFLPMRRFPTVDRTDHIKHKVQGGITNRDDYRASNVIPWESARVRATANEPLYRNNYIYNGQGGGRGELGLFNTWEWALLSSNVFATWPTFVALAENSPSKNKYGRDDRPSGPAGADWYLAPPHPYLLWNELPHNAVANSKTFSKLAYETDSSSAAPAGAQKWTLATTYSYLATSHHPSSGIYTAYMLHPAKHFFDKQFQYFWGHCFHPPSDNIVNAPKSGGVAGDADHVIGFSISNGVRTFAWPIREIARCAGMMHEGHARRAVYRRVALDKFKQFKAMADRTLFGSVACQPAVDVNTPIYDSTRTIESKMPSWLAGQTVPELAFAPNDGTFKLNWNGALDAFKSAYVNMSILHLLDLHACDSPDLAAVDRCLWQLQMLEAGETWTSGRWHTMLGANNAAHYWHDVRLAAPVASITGFSVGDTITISSGGNTAEAKIEKIINDATLAAAVGATVLLLERGANQLKRTSGTPFLLQCGSGWTVARVGGGASTTLTGAISLFVPVDYPEMKIYPTENENQFFVDHVVGNQNFFESLNWINATTASADMNYVPGYNFQKQQHVGLYLTYRYGSTASIRNRAKTMIDLIDATWPDGSDALGFTGVTWAERWMQLNMTPETSLPVF